MQSEWTLKIQAKAEERAESLKKILEVLKKEFPATWQTVAKAIVRVVV